MAPGFSFAFQFMLYLVLLLTGKYNFLFPLFTVPIYCTLFLLDSFDFVHDVHVHSCMFHYFNYYLPDFVTAICLVFIFGFLFLDICFNPT